MVIHFLAQISLQNKSPETHYIKNNVIKRPPLLSAPITNEACPHSNIFRRWHHIPQRSVRVLLAYSRLFFSGNILKKRRNIKPGSLYNLPVINVKKTSFPDVLRATPLLSTATVSPGKCCLPSHIGCDNKNAPMSLCSQNFLITKLHIETTIREIYPMAVSMLQTK